MGQSSVEDQDLRAYAESLDGEQIASPSIDTACNCDHDFPCEHPAPLGLDARVLNQFHGLASADHALPRAALDTSDLRIPTGPRANSPTNHTEDSVFGIRVIRKCEVRRTRRKLSAIKPDYRVA